MRSQSGKMVYIVRQNAIFDAKIKRLEGFVARLEGGIYKRRANERFRKLPELLDRLENEHPDREEGQSGGL